MRVLYASLIGFVAALMLVPLAAAGNRAFPSWDQQISNPGRFRVLGDFADAAVLDKETGLVWEQSPRTDTLNWFNAHLVCNNKSVNGRFGWRLPTLQELITLEDRSSLAVTPTLPSGHPFSNVQSSFYWSATTVASNNDFAWSVGFHNVLLSPVASPSGEKTVSSHVWCVRGGQGVDAQ